MKSLESELKQWIFNAETGYYSQRVNRKYSTISKEFGVRELDVVTLLGKVTLDLPNLVEKSVVRVESAEYYRVIIWSDGTEFYLSLKKDAGPRHYLGLKYQLAFDGK